MPSWPVTLPAPLAGSLTVVSRENVISFSGDVGPPITRRRYTARMVDYSARLLISNALRLELDNFHRDDCEDGNLSFTMIDWVSGAVITCKWTSTPQFSEAGNITHYFANVSFVKTA